MKQLELSRKTVAVVVALGVCGRLVPHPWNFAPMMAIGLYAGAKSAKLTTSICATLLALLISDALLGFYGGMWYVYAASLVPVLMGRFLCRRSEAVSIAVGAVVLQRFVLRHNKFHGVGHWPSVYPHGCRPG